MARASRVVATAVLDILPLALASACSSSTSSATPGSGSQLEKTNPVVGAVPAEIAVALYIAQERGTFAAHGLHVTVMPITSTIDMVADLMQRFGELKQSFNAATLTKVLTSGQSLTSWDSFAQHRSLIGNFVVLCCRFRLMTGGT